MRKAAAVAMVAVLLSTLAGCTALGRKPQPSTPFRPAAGTCHASYVAVGSANTYRPVDCEERHVTETIYVGDLQNAMLRPVAGTQEALAAFKVCDRRSGEFLGGDWHGAKLRLQLTIPDMQDWRAGARWYRCEVSPVELRPSHFSEGWHGSLKGELAKDDSRLALRCLSYDPDDYGLLSIPCTDKHNSEYVGTVPIDVFDDAADRSLLGQRCLAQVAAYAGIADRSDMSERSGVWWDAPEDHEFLGGDHQVRCFAWWDGATKTRSVKGAGLAALPRL